MTSSILDKTPSKLLGETIVSHLIKKGLLDSADAQKITPHLVGGTLKEADWKLVLEKSLGMTGGGEKSNA